MRAADWGGAEAGEAVDAVGWAGGDGGGDDDRYGVRPRLKAVEVDHAGSDD
jgi:hypothetical protein